jgi:hypothetical protein
MLNTSDFAAVAQAGYERDISKKMDVLRQALGQKVHDWYMDQDLTNEYVTVFAHPTCVVTSFRGTDTGSGVFRLLQDVLSDIQLTLGTEGRNPRFMFAREQFRQILLKYFNTTHILASHSLGGSLNMHVYTRYKDDIAHVYNFNPGSGLNLFNQTNDSKVTNLVVRGDPVSTLSMFSSNTQIQDPTPGMNPHTLANFLANNQAKPKPKPVLTRRRRRLGLRRRR